MEKLHPSSIEKIAFRATEIVGSVPSLMVHTVLFAACFVSAFLHLISLDEMLLILTTMVSLEAIYLAIFIQMSVNRTSETLEEVGQDVDEIQESVEEIEKDVDEMQEDVEEIQKDVDEIQEDVEEIHDETEESSEKQQAATLEQLTKDIHRVLADLEQLKKK